MDTIQVDARRLLCPMPVIRLQEATYKAKTDDIIEIVCTDPGTLHDIPAWCRINGHTIELQEQMDGDYHYHVRICE